MRANPSAAAASPRRFAARLTVCVLLSLAGVMIGERKGQAAAAGEEPAPAPETPPPLSEGADAPPAAGRPTEATATPAVMSPAARTHYDRGLVLYGQRQFQAAAVELQQGFALDPRREFLFAEAQAWRLAGDCVRALPLYARFMDSHPSSLQAEAARLGMDRCGPNRASAASTRGPAAVAPPTTTVTAPHLGGTTAAARPWWRDGWSAAAFAASAAALGLGAGFAVASNRARDQAESAQTTTLPEFDRLWEIARQRRAVALVSLTGGVALATAGVIRLWWLHGRRMEPAPAPGTTTPASSTLMLRLLGGAPAVAWQGEF